MFALLPHIAELARTGPEQLIHGLDAYQKRSQIAPK
jgi:hypothetical protein